MSNDVVESPEIKFPRLFKWCKLNTEHPYIVFGIGFSIHFTFLLLTFVFLITKNPQIFYFAFDDIPMYDADYEPFQCYKVWNAVNRHALLLDYDKSLPYSYGYFMRSNVFQFYYDSLVNNIFIPDKFVKIVELEGKLVNTFKEMKICMNCDTYQSAVKMISTISKDQTFKDITETIDLIMRTPNKTRFLKDLSFDFKKIDGNYVAKSMKTRFMIYNIPFDGIEKILSKYRAFYKEYKSYFYLYMECNEFNGEIMLNQVIQDIYLTIGSLLFILSFTFIQTKSIFITVFGIGSMFTTFCISNFIHTLVFKVRFFGIFHVLSIFLILGLGCDNIYVFNDRWKSFEYVDFESLAYRLYKTYTGVGWAMFITSITSATAFCTLIITHLLTIFSFGLFVTLLIIINYVSVLLYFPSIVVIQKIKFHNVDKPDKMFLLFSKIFGVYYYEFLIKKIVKYTILVIFGIIAIIAIIFVSRIRIAEKFPQLLVSSSYHGRMEDLKYGFYKKHEIDKSLNVILMFGIQKLDFSECEFYNYKCLGKVVYDKNFSINTPGIQEEYMRLCDVLLNANSDLQERLALNINPENNIFCLLKNMDEYFTKKYPNESFTIPWTLTNYKNLVQINQQAFKYPPEPNYPSMFELALIYFLSDGMTYSLRGKLIFAKNFPLCKLKSKIAKLGSFPVYKMDFSVILIELTIFQKTSSYTEKNTVFNNWIEFSKKYQKKFKILVCGSQEDLSMNGYFHWIHVQHQLIVAAITGLIAGLLLAIPIVLCATRNIYTFLIIMLGTILSTMSVSSLVAIIGWNLGLLESINLTIIVGLSIDYLVHMGLAYNSSKKNTREEKTQEMLGEMGVSILSGMITTLGSAVFLFFCESKFLFQFGIFIFVTILSAGIYSLLFLPCFFLTFGPEFQKGDFQNFYKNI